MVIISHGTTLKWVSWLLEVMGLHGTPLKWVPWLLEVMGLHGTSLEEVLWLLEVIRHHWTPFRNNMVIRKNYQELLIVAENCSKLLKVAQSCWKLLFSRCEIQTLIVINVMSVKNLFQQLDISKLILQPYMT